MISCMEYVEERKEALKNEVFKLSRPPKLCVIQVGDERASNSYIKGKRQDCEEIGIEFMHMHIKDYESISQEDLIFIVKELNEDNNIDGLIIQLPIPDKYKIEELQMCISPKKDVDGFRPDSCFKPCTPKGIIDWLKFNNYNFVGKNVTVLGRSKIVGKPMVNMLIDEGATVTCCNSHSNIWFYTLRADLVISAIGKPKFLNSNYFDKNTVIVDVGINRDADNKLCGDVNKENVESILSKVYVTPVPCGVGLVTRIALMGNVINAYKQLTEK